MSFLNPCSNTAWPSGSSSSSWEEPTKPLMISTPIFRLHLGSPHLTSCSTLNYFGHHKTCGLFTLPCFLPLPGMPDPHLPKKSSLMAQWVPAGSLVAPACALSGCCLLLSQYCLHFIGLLHFHIYHPGCLLGYHPPPHTESILNLFIKWMNTELCQSHQSLPCRLGLQKKPTLVFPRKAFRGPESHVIFKEVWNGFSPNVAVIVQ